MTADPKTIQKTIEVDAEVSEVWQAWTTEAGATSFFAPAANIEPRVDGLYEMFFMPSAAPGERGGDGLRVLVWQPESTLAFTWNAPPSIPDIRAQRTHVMVQLEPLSENRTRVTLTNSGYASGPSWTAAFEYFQDAWDVVLERLVRRFREGAIDWAREFEG